MIQCPRREFAMVAAELNLMERRIGWGKQPYLGAIRLWAARRGR